MLVRVYTALGCARLGFLPAQIRETINRVLRHKFVNGGNVRNILVRLVAFFDRDKRCEGSDDAVFNAELDDVCFTIAFLYLIEQVVLSQYTLIIVTNKRPR